MTLKNKISFLISSIFTILFAVAACIIFFLFSNFRKVEFESRLQQKAISSIKLLVEVEQVDNQLLKIIDQNTINRLYDEKVLIFDSGHHLIYSSLDDSRINWKIGDLEYLKIHKKFFKREGDHEVYGVFYNTKAEDYYALISATDNYGRRKLEYLFYILLGSYLVFTTLCWFITFYVIKKMLTPLNVFHAEIKTINENNLDTRLGVKSEKNEIDLLASEFNQMLHRIDQSYQKQKEFTSHASHELRTPIARITSQLENRILSKDTDELLKSFLSKILIDVNQVSELTSSLLLLSRLDDKRNQFDDTYRIDEIIYASIERLHKIQPNYRVKFDIQFSEEMDSLMEIKGSRPLLEIAIINLLDNACAYSNNYEATVFIANAGGKLTIAISNNGAALSNEEQQRLFEPFMRGVNAKGKAGLGLGLRIVKRILGQHNATIQYSSADGQTNTFTIIFNA